MPKPLTAAALAAATLLALSAGSAMAASMDQDFEQICLSMTDVDDALVRARKAGYVAAPDEMRKRAGMPKEAVALLHTEEGGMTLILLVRQRLPRGGPFRRPMVAEVCSVGVMEAQPDLNQRMRNLLAVGELQAVKGAGGRRYYIYAQRDGRREPVVATKDTIDALAAEGTLRMAGPSGSNMMLMAPRPEVKAPK